MSYQKIELHLGTGPLSRSQTRRIKACGGKYSRLRSPYQDKRFVTVPASETDLINELVRVHPYGRNTTMIARYGNGADYGKRTPAWVVVQSVDPFVGDRS